LGKKEATLFREAYAVKDISEVRTLLMLTNSSRAGWWWSKPRKQKAEGRRPRADGQEVRG
jgi:hypothetical protein